MALLAEDDDDGGIDGVRQQERGAAKSEGGSVGANKLLYCQSAIDAGLFTSPPAAFVRVSAQVAFLEEGAIEEDDQGVESCAESLLVGIIQFSSRKSLFQIRGEDVGGGKLTVA